VLLAASSQHPSNVQLRNKDLFQAWIPTKLTLPTLTFSALQLEYKIMIWLNLLWVLISIVPYNRNNKLFRIIYFNNKNHIGIRLKVSKQSLEIVVHLYNLVCSLRPNWFLNKYVHHKDNNIQLKNKFKHHNRYQLKSLQSQELVLLVHLLRSKIKFVLIIHSFNK
jgi:hypothetical protein